MEIKFEIFKFLNNLRESEWKHSPVYPEEIYGFTVHFFQKIDFDFKDKRVLDIGCGWGTDAAFIAQSAKEVEGIDIQFRKPWLKLIEKYDNLKFQIGDVCNLPFNKEDFDVVFIKDVLHHISISKRLKGFNEIERVLKNGGKIVIIEPNKYNPIFYFHFTILRHHPHFSGYYFKSLIAKKFSRVKFKHKEIHNWPVKNNFFLSLLYLLEFIWGENTPFKRVIFLYYRYS